MGLSNSAKRRLLELARTAISARLSGGSDPDCRTDDLEIGRDEGAFVTIHHKGNLRGCIGNFICEGSLAETCQEMARSAAFHDPRFRPVSSATELAECELEISVLSPLKETDPGAVEVGRHGIYLIKGRNRGVLLPQVAVEHGWDRETFLDHTCQKAGLEPGCWRSPETKVLTFTAQVFGEKDLDEEDN